MGDLVNTRNSNFVFKGTKLEFIIDGQYDPWFKANVIAEMLNYNCPNQKADTLVDINFRMTYESLLTQECYAKYLFHVQPQTVFINEQGLHKLIISSALEETVEFQDWVYRVVLPSIRKIGEGILKEKYKRMIRNLRLSNARLQQSNARLKQELQETRPDRVIRTKDQNKNPYFYLIKKNVDSKYPYYVLRVQKKNIQSRLKEISKAFPRGKILLRLTGNPYTVNLYNRIKESGYIEFRRNEIRTGLSEENLIHAINEIDFQRF